MENRIKQLIQSQDGQVNIYHALQSKWFGTQWSCSNSDYDELIWLSEDVDKPSKAEIDEEIERLQVEYDALQYQRDREPEYPPMADQLDYIYHNSITKWKSDMIKPVKDAHPKP